MNNSFGRIIIIKGHNAGIGKYLKKEIGLILKLTKINNAGSTVKS